MGLLWELSETYKTFWKCLECGKHSINVDLGSNKTLSTPAPAYGAHGQQRCQASQQAVTTQGGKFHIQATEWGAGKVGPNLVAWDFGLTRVQSLSHIDSATSWTGARQTPLSFTRSQSLLKLTSTESVMLSNRLILCRPLLSSVFPSIRPHPSWV